MTSTADRPEPTIENVQISSEFLSQCSDECDPREADNCNVTVVWKSNSWEVTNLASARILSCAKTNLGSVNINFKKA